MTKSMITRLFIGGLVALAGGVVLLLGTIALAYANDVFVMDGPDVTGIRSAPASWIMIGLIGLATLVIIAGAVMQFAAWIGAVLNTARLEDKTWFVVLLVTGLASFGLIGMIIYLLAGPDGAEQVEVRRDTPVRPAHV